MTQKEKDLLLKDLCSRLFYGIIGEYSWKGNEPYNKELTGNLYDELYSSWNSTEDSKFIPYLRPMSSMTDEELKELKTLCSIYIPTDSPTIGFEDYGVIVFTHHLTNNTYSFKLDISVIDWLNKKMFDYRGLIEKGLALEASKEMYN